MTPSTPKETMSREKELFRKIMDILNMGVDKWIITGALIKLFKNEERRKTNNRPKCAFCGRPQLVGWIGKELIPANQELNKYLKRGANLFGLVTVVAKKKAKSSL